MQSKKKRDIVGNTNLASSEEESAAQYLRANYLQHTNDISDPVVPKNTLYSRYIKRFLDIIISFPVFIILLPVNAILGICTFIDVGRPVLFKQTRVGKDGKLFNMIKFRNMTNQKDKDGKLLPPSQRTTKFGRFMRKYSLDELLNFWSVLKGDMSIIGPRPQPVFIYERMSDRHKMRTCVRPGLECPRMIKLDYEDTCKYQRTFENDVWYVENVSFLLDVKMMWKLVKMVFDFDKRDGQAKGEGVSYFVGYDQDGHAMSLNKYRATVEKKNQKERV